MKKFSLGLVGLGVFGLGTYITTQVYKTNKELEKVRSMQKENQGVVSHDHSDHGDDSCSCNFSVDKTRAIYNRISKNYDDKVDFDEWLIGVTGLRKKLMLHVGGNVLEVAAGSGRNLSEYEKRLSNIEHLTLTDYSGGMLKQAKEKIEKNFQILILSL
ncbi:hypothetical protein FDP41_003176 [Naegleria fowleri]|uniref:Methyltransferase domain-containing protein n=1 Tax=Naegleria fowleri TaxID=5763 RepID=A0A6A5BUC3_NAEFO|nr:uncharacterized protein FDP41_003176 [Naegleria fowleri]KAF0977854.1 hypothetical protein FDP41_003176 [Naegleria fowleri]